MAQASTFADDIAERNEILYAIMTSNNMLLLNAIKKGGDVNRLIDNGLSLLAQAIIIGNEEIVQTMMDAELHLPPEKSTEPRVQHPLSINWETMELRENGKTENGASSSGVDSRSENPQNVDRLVNAIRLLDRLCQSHRRYYCDLNLLDYYERMPIHYAVEKGNVSVLIKLIKAGANVNVCDGKKLTPLHLAVSHNNDMVELLLNAGCRIDTRAHNNTTALHMACHHGCLRSVMTLLRYNADINSNDDSDRTPLFIAVSQSHYRVVEFLLRSGAAVNNAEIHGSTPLCMAVWHRNTELTELLLNFGAKISHSQNLLHHSIRHDSRRIFGFLLHNAACPNSYDEFGETPLHTAVRVKKMAYMQVLLSNGASTMGRCILDGAYPFHVAVDVFTDFEIELFSKVLQLLLNYHADLNCQTYLHGDTILYRTISRGMYKMSKELISQGCNPNVGHFYHFDIDLMGIAMIQGNLRIIKLLLFSGYSKLRSSTFLDIADAHCSEEVNGYISAFQREPMPLTYLCRIAIRRRLGLNVVPKVEAMYLPTECKNFLLFKEPEFD